MSDSATMTCTCSRQISTKPNKAANTATKGLSRANYLRGGLFFAYVGTYRPETPENNNYLDRFFDRLNFNMRAYADLVGFFIGYKNTAEQELGKGFKVDCVRIPCAGEAQTVDSHQMVKVPRSYYIFETESLLSQVSKVSSLLFGSRFGNAANT